MAKIINGCVIMNNNGMYTNTINFGSTGSVRNDARRQKFMLHYAMMQRGMITIDGIAHEMGYATPKTVYVMKANYIKQIGSASEFEAECDKLFIDEFTARLFGDGVKFEMPKKFNKPTKANKKSSINTTFMNIWNGNIKAINAQMVPTNYKLM